MSEEEVKSVKVVLLGETGVGKTCIISRFVNNLYDDKTTSNLTPAFTTKTMKFARFNGKEIKFDLWDTAGQERFRSVTKSLYRDAKVIILVYDITEKETFNEVKDYWYEQIKLNSANDVILGLAGNKCDLFENEVVTEEEGKELAKEMGAIFKLTSSKEKVGINELFQDIGYKLLGSIDPNNDENQEQSSLFNTMMDGFEIVDKKYIKLDEFPVKKMEIKTCC